MQPKVTALAVVIAMAWAGIPAWTESRPLLKAGAHYIDRLPEGYHGLWKRQRLIVESSAPALIDQVEAGEWIIGGDQDGTYLVNPANGVRVSVSTRMSENRAVTFTYESNPEPGKRCQEELTLRLTAPGMRGHQSKTCRRDDRTVFYALAEVTGIRQGDAR